MTLTVDRFAMDLALWEPASREEIERVNSESILVSCMDVLQPAATQQDRFTMCQSTLREGGYWYILIETNLLRADVITGSTKQNFTCFM